MRRGEIRRTDDLLPERGGKPGFYVIAGRQAVAANDAVSTVICAPVYSEILGLSTEVVIGTEHGMPHDSAIRCDFLTLVFKRRLTGFVGRLSEAKLRELDRALGVALDLRQ